MIIYSFKKAELSFNSILINIRFYKFFIEINVLTINLIQFYFYFFFKKLKVIFLNHYLNFFTFNFTIYDIIYISLILLV